MAATTNNNNNNINKKVEMITKNFVTPIAPNKMVPRMLLFSLPSSPVWAAAAAVVNAHPN